MAYAASAWRLMKKVEMNSESTNTSSTMKTDTSLPCRKKLMIATTPANRKWEQIR